MSKTKIESLLMEAFAPTYLQVIDDSAKHAGHAHKGQGGHYLVEISSPIFAGRKFIECHRMIYKTLEPIKESIHALGIKIR